MDRTEPLFLPAPTEKAKGFRVRPGLSFHHGVPWNGETNSHACQIGILFCGRNAADTGDDAVFLAANVHWEPHTQTFPNPPQGYRWKLAFHTACQDPFQPDPQLFDGETLLLGERSVAATVLERCW